MVALIIVGLALLGLCLGSFANAYIWRLHEQEELRAQIFDLKNKKLKSKNTVRKSKIKDLEVKVRAISIANGRSRCIHCGHELAAKDLIPVLSWLSLGGKCRYCKMAIEDTPLAELLVPVLFLISYVFWPWPLSGYGLVAFCLWLMFIFGFVVLAIYDIKWFILPDRIVWPLAVLATIQVVLHAVGFDGGWPVIVEAVWGVIIASGLFYVLYIVSGGRWIGGGDVKLGIVLGLLVGGPMSALLLLFSSSMLGTIYSVPLLANHKLKRTSLIPFGPFLLAGTIFVVLFGSMLIQWFNRLVVG